MSGNKNFLLSKWYLDCIADDGTLFLGYSATVRWKMLSFHYSSILVRNASAHLHAESSWSRDALPEYDGTTVRWSSRLSNLEGDWSRVLEPIERRLYEGDKGEICWSCFLPKARARIALHNFPPIEGLGYVECLKMSIVPWRLPMDTLRWGRFLTDQDSLIWIDWKGETQKTLALYNCSEASNAFVTDDEIVADEGLKLSLEQSSIVRSGPIVSALANIPGLKWFLPASISQIHERKWLSKGSLIVPDCPARTGWSIHEVVRFK